ncbi:hypothetical protein [Marinobacterium marinum]|uniref:Uncharacterized protein n=1 Tax=Marinobacterium marinum TaxID=2756129 RepID=A0A7W1WZF8_9GAMM|nr:hypothetical protein [Marinobacterium marinum]MBA4502912.1 hypothetical protein [Marinobacterium marinum]
MSVQTVGTRGVTNPGNNFQICIPEHWKASGYQDNPGLLIVQSDVLNLDETLNSKKTATALSEVPQNSIERILLCMKNYQRH